MFRALRLSDFSSSLRTLAIGRRWHRNLQKNRCLYLKDLCRSNSDRKRLFWGSAYCFHARVYCGSSWSKQMLQQATCCQPSFFIFMSYVVPTSSSLSTIFVSVISDLRHLSETAWRGCAPGTPGKLKPSWLLPSVSSNVLRLFYWKLLKMETL